jgi:hypothetical protein
LGEVRYTQTKCFSLPGLGVERVFAPLQQQRDQECVYDSGFRAQGSGFRARGLGFRVQGSAFRAQGLSFEGFAYRV